MIAQVALPLPIAKLFSYRLPDYMITLARTFSRVKVPFGNRSLVGFIVSIDDVEEQAGVLKSIEELIDPMPLMSRTCYELCNWASRYYASPIGLALKYGLSSAISIERYCEVLIGEDAPLLSRPGLSLKKACAVLGREVVYERLSQGTMWLSDIFTQSPIERGEPEGGGAGFRVELRVGAFEDRLEYYCTLLSDQLLQGKNCLMLLPDRHDVGEFFSRALAKRFPGAVSWYGSSMGARKRAEVYFSGRSRGGQLILGNRSAVFLPLRSLGLMIVERPEEDQYRNEDAFKFNAVQLAIRKAQIEAVPVILGSVSPTVEIMKLVEEGEILLTEGDSFPAPTLSSIGNERVKGQQLGLPAEVIEAVGEALCRGGHVVVHTPKRAYAAGLNCSACGQTMACLACGSLSVSYQRDENRLICGNCKSSVPYVETCPLCGSSFIRFFDIGAEYLESLLKDEFPGVPVIRLTGEKGRKLKRPRGTERLKHQGAIVVGTHVLSKLYGFNTDLLILYGWDRYLRSGGGGFRAQEQMFQLFRNLLDCLRPQRLLVCAADREPLDLSPFLDFLSFYADELSRRRMADFPPYERFFLVNILKRSKAAGDRVIKSIERLIRDEDLEHRMLGPIEVKGQYAWRIVLKGDEDVLSPLLSTLYRLPGVHIEADPLYV
jgi:primosomal protein N' (replication factor Y) (superfamily II helicase)